MLENVIVLVILAVVLCFLIYTIMTAKKNSSVSVVKELEMPTGFSDRYWNDVQLEQIEKTHKPGSKGRNEGSNNSPMSSAMKVCATEMEIISAIKSHYNEQITRIRSWKIKGTDKDVQSEFRNAKRLISSNGYQQEYNKMVASWNAALEGYRLRVKDARQERREAREAVRQFKIQNNLMAGREPQVHKKHFQLIKILIPFLLFGTEVGLNITGLAKAVGGSEAIVVSFMLSSINVGLSFAVGVLVLTHFFNPVGASKPKITYIIWIVLFMGILVYINSMMGVFRAMTEMADLASNPVLAEQMATKALTSAVYPFDDMGQITFGGAFLMLVGFFFAFLSLLDAYFFKDPIPGYGKLGERRSASEKRLEKIKHEETLVFVSTESAALAKLEAKNNERLHANECWKFMVDELQIVENRYNNFIESIKGVMQSAIDIFRVQNLKFRTDAAPQYFQQPLDLSFVKSFDQNYSHLSDELVSDEISERVSKENRINIEREYKDMQDKYINFFATEKSELFKIVQEIGS